MAILLAVLVPSASMVPLSFPQPHPHPYPRSAPLPCPPEGTTVPFAPPPPEGTTVPLTASPCSTMRGDLSGWRPHKVWNGVGRWQQHNAQLGPADPPSLPPPPLRHPVS